MNQFLEVMNIEMQKLVKLKEKIEIALSKKPEGKLRVSKCRTTVQYYYKSNNNSGNGKYIPKTQQRLIQQLAQKEYEEELHAVLGEKIRVLNKCVDEYQRLNLVSLYEHMPVEKRKWITPYEVSDEEFVYQWMSMKYEGKMMTGEVPLIYTDKGERVRSKSEKIIADKLYAMNIPYRYEYPIKLKGYGIVYPDFCVLNVRTRKEYYLEHLGMMDSQEYAEKAISKINTYALNKIYLGKQLILTHETKMQPLDSRVLDGLFKECFL